MSAIASAPTSRSGAVVITDSPRVTSLRKIRPAVTAVALAGIVVWITLIKGDQAISDYVVMAAMYAVMAVGYDFTIGMTRQFALGMNACVAVGAYAAGLLALKVTPNPLLGALLACAFGAAVAFATALLAVRVREFYFAVLTLAVGLTAQNLAIAWQTLTGGASGLVAVPGLGDSTIVKPDFGFWLPLTVGSVAILSIIGLWVRDSSLGRTFRTIARDEELAKAFGIPVGRYRTLAMTMTGFVLGYGGFLYARYVQFVVPDSFSLGLTVTLILMVYLGGRGSIWGPVIGAVLVRAITRGLQGHGEVSSLVLACVLIGVLALFADGIAGGVRAAQRHLRQRANR
jgi:branched-chain amino acid transport system permease protein